MSKQLTVRKWNCRVQGICRYWQWGCVLCHTCWILLRWWVKGTTTCWTTVRCHQSVLTSAGWQGRDPRTLQGPQEHPSRLDGPPMGGYLVSFLYVGESWMSTVKGSKNSKNKLSNNKILSVLFVWASFVLFWVFWWCWNFFFLFFIPEHLVFNLICSCAYLLGLSSGKEQGMLLFYNLTLTSPKLPSKNEIKAWNWKKIVFLLVLSHYHFQPILSFSFHRAIVI